MPHQCLTCGFAFEEGSSALLKGCPECKGTRFFYSAEAVSEDRRKQIAGEAQKDLRQVVSDLLQEASPETAKELQDRAGDDGFVELKARDIRKLVKKVQAQTTSGPTPERHEEAERRQEVVETARKRLELELAERSQAEEKPDTVTVGDGQYDIDIKGLLEKNPIVVHKDGAYLIHLPSLFGDKD